jgi:hypothetical protein
VPVDDDELLARFVTHKKELNSETGRVKPCLFIPYKYVELSVTRHDRPDPNIDLLVIGRAVAAARGGRTLLGQTDILARDCRDVDLDVAHIPVPTNPNHADIVGYSDAKEDQLAVGQKLARAATSFKACD